MATFDFSGYADGTLLSSIDSRWKTKDGSGLAVYGGDATGAAATWAWHGGYFEDGPASPENVFIANMSPGNYGRGQPILCASAGSAGYILAPSWYEGEWSALDIYRDGQWLAWASVSLQAGTYCEVTFKSELVSGGLKLTVEIDGTIYLTHIDSNPLSGWPGFRSYHRDGRLKTLQTSEEIIAQGANASASATLLTGNAAQRHDVAGIIATAGAWLNAGSASNQHHLLAGTNAAANSTAGIGGVSSRHVTTGTSAFSASAAIAGRTIQRHQALGSNAASSEALTSGAAGQKHITTGAVSSASSQAEAGQIGQTNMPQGAPAFAPMTALAGALQQHQNLNGGAFWVAPSIPAPESHQNQMATGINAEAVVTATSGASAQRHGISGDDVGAAAIINGGQSYQRHITGGAAVSIGNVLPDGGDGAQTHIATGATITADSVIAASGPAGQHHIAQAAPAVSGAAISVIDVVEHHTMTGASVAASSTITSGGAIQHHLFAGDGATSDSAFMVGQIVSRHVASGDVATAGANADSGMVAQQQIVAASYTSDELLSCRAGATVLDLTINGQNSIEKTGRYGWILGDRVPVDRSQQYRLSAFVRQQGSDPAPRHYLGFACFDAGGSTISLHHFHIPDPATKTKLAQPLKYGDTEIVLQSTDGWNVGHPFFFAAFGYTDGAGNHYPDYYYTRDTYYLNGRATISGNKIILSDPWSGPYKPAGTAVANTRSGNTYSYALLYNQPAPEQWERRTAIIGPEVADNSPLVFRPATAEVALAVFANYADGDNTTLFLQDASVAEAWNDPAVQNHQSSGVDAIAAATAIGGSVGQQHEGAALATFGGMDAGAGSALQRHDTTGGAIAADVVASGGTAKQNHAVISEDAAAAITATAGAAQQNHTGAAESIVSAGDIPTAEMLYGSLVEAEPAIAASTMPTGVVAQRQQVVASSIHADALLTAGRLSEQMHAATASVATVDAWAMTGGVVQAQSAVGVGASAEIGPRQITPMGQVAIAVAGGATASTDMPDGAAAASSHQMQATGLSAATMMRVIDTTQAHTMTGANTYCGTTIGAGGVKQHHDIAGQPVATDSIIADGWASQLPQLAVTGITTDSSITTGGATQHHIARSTGLSSGAWSTSGEAVQTQQAAGQDAFSDTEQQAGEALQQHLASSDATTSDTVIPAVQASQLQQAAGGEITAASWLYGGEIIQRAIVAGGDIQAGTTMTGGGISQGHAAVSASVEAAAALADAVAVIQAHMAESELFTPDALAAAGNLLQQHISAGTHGEAMMFAQNAVAIQHHQLGALFPIAISEAGAGLLVQLQRVITGEVVNAITALNDGDVVQVQIVAGAEALAETSLPGAMVAAQHLVIGDTAASWPGISMGRAAQNHATVADGVVSDSFIGIVGVQQMEQGRVISISPIFSVRSISSTKAKPNSLTRE